MECSNNNVELLMLSCNKLKACSSHEDEKKWWCHEENMKKKRNYFLIWCCPLSGMLCQFHFWWRILPSIGLPTAVTHPYLLSSYDGFFVLDLGMNLIVIIFVHFIWYQTQHLLSLWLVHNHCTTDDLLYHRVIQI